MNRLLILLTALCIGWTSACASPGAPTLQSTPIALGTAWTMKMTQSGGIAGISRSIEVSADGSYTATDERAKTSKSGTLSASELADLNQLAASLAFVPPGPSGCADCFEYSVEISSGGQKSSYAADDVTLAGTGLGPLVQALRAIMERELQG